MESAPIPGPPLKTEPGTYNHFYKQKAMKVIKCVPDENLNFTTQEESSHLTDNFMYRVVSLPTGRVFVIGGAKDINGSTTLKDTKELVDGQLVEKAGMWISRAAFGVAVYPNHTQIFIAGGRINN